MKSANFQRLWIERGDKNKPTYKKKKQLYWMYVWIDKSELSCLSYLDYFKIVVAFAIFSTF